MKIPAKGATARAALAGKLVGQAQAYQRDIQRAERMQERLMSIAAQKEMAAYSQQVALERTKFNATIGFEKEKRAQLWEIEKMELRSRVDFQKEEMGRLKKESEYERGIELIRDTTNLTDSQKEDAFFKLQMHHATGYVPSIPAEREEREERGPSETEIARAVKFLSEWEEPGKLGGLAHKLTRGFLGAEPPTEGERKLKTHYEKLIEEGFEAEPTLPTNKPIYQENVKTGERRVSYDGGKTWQMIG